MENAEKYSEAEHAFRRLLEDLKRSIGGSFFNEAQERDAEIVADSLWRLRDLLT